MNRELRLINYEQLVREGVTAARSGRRVLARRLLERAVYVNPTDSHAWLWLSATTDDLEQQRGYLERAVAADPFNTAARRGLAILSGKLDVRLLIPQGESVPPHRSPEPDEARSSEFTCQQCGGRMYFDPQGKALVCEYCASNRQDESTPVDETEGQPVDFVLPTARGHLWTEAQQKLGCDKCGAITLLLPEQKTSQCPYCGAHQLIESAIRDEMVDPQAIGLQKIDEQSALEHVQEWLNEGNLAPDKLRYAVEKLQLRPAYYPFWTFDGTLKIRWEDEMQTHLGMGSDLGWMATSGEELILFDDVLVPGAKSLSSLAVSALAPFELKELIAYKTDHLAGWRAMTYDRPMADASLLAREQVMQRARAQLNQGVEPGREKRDLRVGAGEWAGLTFKHILLPLWSGSYEYQGRTYRFMVNGQTGKVAGERPRDALKLGMVYAGGVGVLITLAALLVLFLIVYGGSLLNFLRSLFN